MISLVIYNCLRITCCGPTVVRSLNSQQIVFDFDSTFNRVVEKSITQSEHRTLLRFLQKQVNPLYQNGEWISGDEVCR